MTETEFIANTYRAATRAGHPFPDITTAEAAFESQFGTSAVALRTNNVFNLRGDAEYTFPYPRVKLCAPIGTRTIHTAHWTVFPDVETCLRERHAFLIYRSKWDAGITEALRLVELQATDTTSDYAEAYLRSLCKNIVGPTDRADQVLAIRKQYALEFVCAPVYTP